MRWKDVHWNFTEASRWDIYISLTDHVLSWSRGLACAVCTEDLDGPRSESQAEGDNSHMWSEVPASFTQPALFYSMWEFRSVSFCESQTLGAFVKRPRFSQAFLSYSGKLAILQLSKHFLLVILTSASSEHLNPECQRGRRTSPFGEGTSSVATPVTHLDKAKHHIQPKSEPPSFPQSAI